MNEIQVDTYVAVRQDDLRRNFKIFKFMRQVEM